MGNGKEKQRKIYMLLFSPNYKGTSASSPLKPKHQKDWKLSFPFHFQEFPGCPHWLVLSPVFCDLGRLGRCWPRVTAARSLTFAPLPLSSRCCPSGRSFPVSCTVPFLLLDSRVSYSLRACPWCSVSLICTEGLVSLPKIVHLEKVRTITGTQGFCLQIPCSSSSSILFLAMLCTLQDLRSQTRAQTQAPAARATSPNNWTARDFPRLPALTLC